MSSKQSKQHNKASLAFEKEHDEVLFFAKNKYQNNTFELLKSGAIHKDSISLIPDEIIKNAIVCFNDVDF